MSFSDDFTSCLSPLPAPQNVLDSAGDFLEWLHQLKDAWDAAGGNDEALITGLIAAGAVTGIDEAAVATLAGVTVATYIAACLGCLASAAGSAVWDLISSTDDSYLKDKLTVAANDKGIPKDTQVA